MLVAHVDQAEDYLEFVRLVREFLPERESEILREPSPSTQVARFASFFEDRYFPLSEHLQDMAEGYAELTYQIPVVVMGMSEEDYESIATESGAGYQLLTYLVENPWGYHDAQNRFHGNGRLVSLTEACAALVPQHLLLRVPEEGFSPQRMHEVLDKTRFKAAAIWADMLGQCTNNIFLDTDYEQLGYSQLPEWTREEVESLTAAWHQAELLHQEVSELVRWLEENLTAHFIELVNHIGGYHEPDPRQLRLPLGDTGET